MKKIAIIRVRGPVNASSEINDTFRMLKLYRRNYCTIIDSKPESLGMLKKVKDYVAWGELEPGFAEKLPKSGFIKLRHVGRFKRLGMSKRKNRNTGNQKEAIQKILIRSIGL
ncbi:uL30 family ribosomal protein [Candidatus Woesearchaeota archaeon]|nr:uL30 family ribosomal protein [Candidatus Woesearchaeota archaeon]